MAPFGGHELEMVSSKSAFKPASEFFVRIFSTIWNKSLRLAHRMNAA
ncbi:hypothetical protein M673_07705 [Aureimonas sp. AU20]|nr:hypothetical protein M673_07705 [Aureimonas sp. AU20]